MSQKIQIFIPTFISDAAYAPARVAPRLYFFNGAVECEQWYMSSLSEGTLPVNEFPYFDHYNVVADDFPTTDSRSLLFNNEAQAYGSLPTNNLYTQYWNKYISLLYSPKTRLMNAAAIIPLADYFDMELNDIMEFKGNYWHLRAINDYNLKTGECNVQLLGPILEDSLNFNPESGYSFSDGFSDGFDSPFVI